MAKYWVSYKLYGTVEVEAECEDHAQAIVEDMTDKELLNGLETSNGMIDSVDIYSIEENY